MRQHVDTFHSSLRFKRNEHPAAAFSFLDFLPDRLFFRNWEQQEPPKK
jgi:hypothetical protein